MSSKCRTEAEGANSVRPWLGGTNEDVLAIDEDGEEGIAEEFGTRKTRKCRSRACRTRPSRMSTR